MISGLVDNISNLVVIRPVFAGIYPGDEICVILVVNVTMDHRGKSTIAFRYPLLNTAAGSQRIISYNARN